MVYAGRIGDQELSLGVSGRLQDDNLVMWDPETESLWNQITGRAVWGPSKGRELPMLPAVIVGFDTWRALHPDTKVLDLDLVRATSWYYTTRDLARGRARGGRRGRDLQLAIGLRHANDTLAVTLDELHEHGAVNVEVGAIPLAVVWHGGESAALVYDRRVGERIVELRNDRDTLIAGGEQWDALTGDPVETTGPALARFPYVPTFLEAWNTYYPNGRVRD